MAAPARSIEPTGVRVEIRVGGKLRFVQECYDTSLQIENDTVHFHAALHPTLVNVATRPPQPVAEKRPPTKATKAARPKEKTP